MFKKILFTGFVLSFLLFNSSVVSAEETNFIRSEVFAPNIILHEDATNLATIPCNSKKTCDCAKPCPCGKANCDCQKPCDCGKADCTKCNKNAVKEDCCKDPCEKTAPCWAEGKTCDRHIKKLYKFFSEADCKVGLTPEQKEKSMEIKKSAEEEIISLKREIAAKKSEIIALKRTKLCQKEMDKQVNALEKEVKNLKKEVKNVFKKADKEYKSILNAQQNKTYRAFKKEWKHKMQTCKKHFEPKADCGCNEPCDCPQPCPCPCAPEKPCEVK